MNNENFSFGKLSRKGKRSNPKKNSKIRKLSRKQFRDDCSLCLLHMKPKDVRTLPCRHRFHRQCIGQWLHAHNTCPLCRQIVPAPVRIPAYDAPIPLRRTDSAQNYPGF